MARMTVAAVELGASSLCPHQGRLRDGCDEMECKKRSAKPGSCQALHLEPFGHSMPLVLCGLELLMASVASQRGGGGNCVGEWRFLWKGALRRWRCVKCYI